MPYKNIELLKIPEIRYTDNEQKTQDLGYGLGRLLTGGCTVTLHGDLGSGKTVFARGIANGIGVKEPVTSPTFNLVQEYRGDKWTLYHIDLYRINDAWEALSLGIEDFFNNPKAIIVIEWAERAQNIIENAYYEVYISYKGLQKRKIDIKSIAPVPRY